VTDALRSGIHQISQRPPAGLEGDAQAGRFRHWGLIAFWAGLATLLGQHVGVVLMVAGIGLMAYAKGLFGPPRGTSPISTSDFQMPSSRKSTYSTHYTPQS